MANLLDQLKHLLSPIEKSLKQLEPIESKLESLESKVDDMTKKISKPNKRLKDFNRLLSLLQIIGFILLLWAWLEEKSDKASLDALKNQQLNYRLLSEGLELKAEIDMWGASYFASRDSSAHPDSSVIKPEVGFLTLFDFNELEIVKNENKILNIDKEKYSDVWLDSVNKLAELNRPKIEKFAMEENRDSLIQIHNDYKNRSELIGNSFNTEITTFANYLSEEGEKANRSFLKFYVLGSIAILLSLVLKSLEYRFK